LSQTFFQDGVFAPIAKLTLKAVREIEFCIFRKARDTRPEKPYFGRTRVPITDSSACRDKWTKGGFTA